MSRVSTKQAIQTMQKIMDSESARQKSESRAAGAPAVSAPRKIVATACAAALAFSLVGCGAGAGGSAETAGANGASSAAGAVSATTSTGNAAATAHRVTVGTLATEDILPFWVAADEGLFADANLDASIVIFQSATELIAAVTAGDVDYAMTDPMVAASIYAGGTDISIQWVTLGATAAQGRFGIMTANPNIKTLQDLAGKEIGVGSNTILEYVMDTLMENAGIAEADIKTSELQKLPVRYQAMASGRVEAAALPASLLALGEANGFTVVADDTAGENISQSVMVARADALAAKDGVETLAALKSVWNKAAAEINANPESYRALLAENANLADDVAATYPVSDYPTCQLPTQQQVDDVLSWMKRKGYLTANLAYNAADGTFSIE